MFYLQLQNYTFQQVSNALFYLSYPAFFYTPPVQVCCNHQQHDLYFHQLSYTVCITCHSGFCQSLFKLSLFLNSDSVLQLQEFLFPFSNLNSEAKPNFAHSSFAQFVSNTGHVKLSSLNLAVSSLSSLFSKHLLILSHLPYLPQQPVAVFLHFHKHTSKPLTANSTQSSIAIKLLPPSFSGIYTL